MDESLRLELLASRKARLAKLLRMNAPDSIIAEECLLVIRAYAGGSRWDSLRFVLTDIARHWRCGIERRVELLACRVLGRHTWGAALDERFQETGMEECCYCAARRETP